MPTDQVEESNLIVVRAPSLIDWLVVCTICAEWASPIIVAPAGAETNISLVPARVIFDPELLLARTVSRVIVFTALYVPFPLSQLSPLVIV